MFKKATCEVKEYSELVVIYLNKKPVFALGYETLDELHKKRKIGGTDGIVVLTKHKMGEKIWNEMGVYV